MPWKGRRQVHRERRSDNERRQTRQSPKSEHQEILQGPLLCHVASSIAHIINCFLTEPEAYRRKVDSEEEEEEDEGEEEEEEKEEEDEQVVVVEEEEKNRPVRDEKSAKMWPHKGKTPRGRPPKIRPQQQTTGNRPKEHRSHQSGGTEDLSPAVRRSPRRKEGLKQTVKEFARQVQVEGQAEKPTERRSLKLAGSVLDPHVMSSSIESDTSSATHTVRHSPRKNSVSAIKNNTPRKLADLDSFDLQPLGKRRKLTPEVKKRAYTRAANQSRCVLAVVCGRGCMYVRMLQLYPSSLLPPLPYPDIGAFN